MKLVRSVYAYILKQFSPRYLYYTYYTYRGRYIYEIYAVAILSQSQICLCGRIYGSIKLHSALILPYTGNCLRDPYYENYVLLHGLSHSFEWTARVVNFEYFWLQVISLRP